jgi:hypothetical protein
MQLAALLARQQVAPNAVVLDRDQREDRRPLEPGVLDATDRELADASSRRMHQLPAVLAVADRRPVQKAGDQPRAFTGEESMIASGADPHRAHEPPPAGRRRHAVSPPPRRIQRAGGRVVILAAAVGILVAVRGMVRTF